MAPSIECPCIVVAFYLSEDIGWTLELMKAVDTLIKFYGYEEIKNQKEGSPYLVSLKR